MIEDPSPLAAFVVGTGRCGSTLLSELLRDFSNILSISELFAVLGGPAALEPDQLDGSALWRRLSEIGDDAWELITVAPPMQEILADVCERATAAPLKLVPLPHLGKSSDEVYSRLRDFTCGLPRSATAEAYSRVFDWLRLEFGKKRWIERSGGSLEYVDRILRLWPNAKVVHIYRGGPACALSMAGHPFFRLRVARVLARDERLSVRAAMERDIPIERFGAYWSAVLQHGVRTLGQLPARQVIHVAFDELAADPVATLQGVLTFLEAGRLSADEQDEVTSRIKPRAAAPDRLTDEQRSKLERMCGPGTRIIDALASNTSALLDRRRKQGGSE